LKRAFRRAIEIDRVPVDSLHQQPRDVGSARFGVAKGGGGAANLSTTKA
jgi:hypothetical protein